MKGVISFFVLFFIPAMLKSRDTSAIETREVDRLLELSFQSVLKVNTDSSLQYALDALLKSEQIDYSAGKSKAYFYIGRLCLIWGVTRVH